MKHQKFIFLSLFTCLFILIACVERGKPVKKETQEQATKNTNKKIAHYICKNGHQGSDKQGICPECNTAYEHNQAYHGLSIPQNNLKDPFQSNTTNASTPAPAQNAYGDYHYICPDGHPGGAGKAENCSVCSKKLVHNQQYHK